MRVPVIAAAGAALLLLACAGPRLRPPPTSLDHGMLYLHAEVAGALLPFLRDEADSAVVDLLGPDGEPVPGRFAVAGLAKDGDVIFVDLPPGRYALREVAFNARGVRYAATIPVAISRKRAVTLAPGKAAFLGSIALEGRFPEFDVAVDRAVEIVGHWLTPWTWGRRPTIARDADLRIVDDRRETEGALLRRVRPLLEGTQWRGILERRLRELAVPEPVKTVGRLRPKELPLQPGGFFSWRDTLEWGPPSAAPGGLAWRDPKGSARIALFFTSATAKGFAGYDAALAQLRAAASSLDDPAALYEVRVDTGTGTAARSTEHRYPQGTLVGSEVEVLVTETVLVRHPEGMFTARLRARREDFDAALASFREFLLQLVLGAREPPKKSDDEDLPQ